jgi:CheY-like chemotaxis protein
MKSTSKLPQSNSLKVLVVEDEYSQVRGTQSALKHLGFVFDQANNIEIAEKLIKNKVYDLLIIDVRMPEKNHSGIVLDGGIQFLKRLRAGEYGKRNLMTPFLILTALEISNLLYIKTEFNNCIGVYGKLMHLVLVKDVREYFRDKLTRQN